MWEHDRLRCRRRAPIGQLRHQPKEERVEERGVSSHTRNPGSTIRESLSVAYEDLTGRICELFGIVQLPDPFKD
jgi:hypothetical protein